MGFSEVGGNGSVEWTVEADNVDSVTSQPKAGGGHRQGGVDRSQGANPGQRFTISIKPPRGVAAEAFRRVLQEDRDPNDPDAPGMAVKDERVEFTLVIENRNRDQIRVRWGSEVSVNA